MPSTQSKGRQLEYAVRRKLRSLGFVVFRCAGSRPVDLIAFRDGKITLVECKTGLNPHLPEQQAKRILDLAKQIRASCILTIRKKHRGIKWFKVTKQGLTETGPPVTPKK
jgi:Holliday junction resolvase